MAAETGRSIADLLQDILGNVQSLIRSEVRLAKVEITEEAKKAAKASGLMAGGAVAALFTFWLLLLAGLFALSIVLPLWAAALIMFGIMAIATAILLAAGKKRFKTVRPAPEKTIQTVKEDVQWVKSQTK